MLSQILTAFLEMTFIVAVLTALCHQRKRIGVAPAIMAFGAILFFGNLMSAADVVFYVGRWSFDFARVLVYLPLLASFLLVYISLGVLKAQRLLLGTMCAFLLYLYFGMLIKIQCSILPADGFRELVYIMISEGAASVNLDAVSNLISMLSVPVLFSAFPQIFGRPLRIFLALFCSLLLGALPEAVLFWINGALNLYPKESLIIALATTPVLALMMSAYLAMQQKETPTDSVGAFDFIFAFFGSYGRVKELENDLSSWENRYHLVLRHSADMIVMTDEKGIIQEGNIAASSILGSRSPARLIGSNLFDMLKNVDPADIELTAAVTSPLYFDCVIDRSGQEKIISASLSPIRLKDRLLLVMVGRDITEETKLAQEKEELAGQLMHSQRMESLGMLAGGIAHDFNNSIHAIMGHADVAVMLYANDPEKVTSHLNKISSIAEKAGKLTSQLLGFARKGKYNVVDIDLPQLMEDCTGLLDPFRTRGVELTCSYPSIPLIIRGDHVQMQQVILNMLINALDASAGKNDGRWIKLTAGKAADAPLKFSPTPDYPDADVADYLFFSVEDNGTGMDEEIRKKIFEPFFTTKPVGSGTGMGLAMVYGTVTHHRGWIQLHSEVGKGTLFCFFLPAAADSRS